MRKKRLKLANRPLKRLKGDRPVAKRIIPGKTTKKSAGCGCGRKKRRNSKNESN